MQQICIITATSSMTEQRRIRIDMPEIAVGPKKSMKMHGAMLFMPCSPGTWHCTDETG